MLRKVTIIVPFIVAMVLLISCNLIKQNNHKAFRIKEAYYQSWVVSDDEKGTDILLTLGDVKKGVEFDSIVFRGVRLRAFATGTNDEVSLKSVLTSGIPRLKLDKTVVNLPDQLIYRFNGQRKSCLLNGIERKSTKFYRPSDK